VTKLTERVALGTIVLHPLNSPMHLVLWLNFPGTAILGWPYGMWADLGRINDPILTGMTRHPHPSSSESESSDSETASSVRERSHRHRNSQHRHSNKQRRRELSSSSSRLVIKPIAPKEYDGSANARSYHRFVRESEAYLQDGKVKGQRKIFLLLYYLTRIYEEWHTPQMGNS
jgi:hypothetical protein